MKFRLEAYFLAINGNPVFLSPVDPEAAGGKPYTLSNLYSLEEIKTDLPEIIAPLRNAMTVI